MSEPQPIHSLTPPIDNDRYTINELNADFGGLHEEINARSLGGLATRRVDQRDGINYFGIDDGKEITETFGLSENQQKIFAPPETEPMERQKTAFEIADQILGRASGEDINEYDKLYGPDEGLAYRSVKKAYVQSAEIGRGVTETSEKEAEAALGRVNNFLIKETIDNAARTSGINRGDRQAVVGLIRTNASLRYELAAGMLRDIDGLAASGALPERVGRKDESKSPARNYGGFSQISSRDYIAALALSVLDGTFDKTKADGEQDLPLKQTKYAQHRAIVRALLFNEF